MTSPGENPERRSSVNSQSSSSSSTRRPMPLDERSFRVVSAGAAAEPDVARLLGRRLAEIGDSLERLVPSAETSAMIPRSSPLGPLDYLCSAARAIAFCFKSRMSKFGHCVKWFILSPLLGNLSYLARCLSLRQDSATAWSVTSHVIPATSHMMPRTGRLLSLASSSIVLLTHSLLMHKVLRSMSRTTIRLCRTTSPHTATSHYCQQTAGMDDSVMISTCIPVLIVLHWLQPWLIF